MEPFCANRVPAQPRLSEAETGRFVTVDLSGRRLRMHYHAVGGVAATAPVVVLLHGSGPGTTAWGSFRRNIEALVDAGHRVLLVDLPGWGKSDAIICTGSRPELNARAVGRLLDVLHIQRPVHVIGSSMGAHSSVALALAEPHRVDRLVLVAGGTGTSPGSVPTEGARRMQAFYRAPSLQRLRELLEITTASTSHLTDDFLRARLDGITARPDHVEAFVASLDASPCQFPDMTPRLAEVRVPSLLVWGREDQVVPLEVGLRLLSGLHDAQLHVVGNCGHVPHQEHPDVFNRLAVAFLER